MQLLTSSAHLRSTELCKAICSIGAQHQHSDLLRHAGVQPDWPSHYPESMMWVAMQTQ